MDEIDWDRDPEALTIAARYSGRAFRERRRFRVEAFEQWGDEEWTLADFTRLFEEAVAKIPPAERDDATVEYRSGGYDESGCFRILYSRDETDAEMAKRIGEVANYVRNCRANERRTYESLKRKYEEAPPHA